MSAEALKRNKYKTNKYFFYYFALVRGKLKRAKWQNQKFQSNGQIIYFSSVNAVFYQLEIARFSGHVFGSVLSAFINEKGQTA
jgi:hypothetical protein